MVVYLSCFPDNNLHVVSLHAERSETTRALTMKLPSSLSVLIAANLTPLAGVIFLGWDIFPILVLFWFENLIAGVFFIMRILLADTREKKFGESPRGLKIFLSLFFSFHYGIFVAVHGIFVFSMFSEFTDSYRSYDLADAFLVITDYQLGWSIAAIAISHGYSFIQNYLVNGEYRNTSFKTLMFSPYRRVIILHLTVILSAFAVIALNQKITTLVILLVIKIAFDIHAHMKEHRHTN